MILHLESLIKLYEGSNEMCFVPKTHRTSSSVPIFHKKGRLLCYLT